MNEQYISLFQQYKTVNPLVSETEFQGYIDKYGDEYLTMVDEEIKKKIPSDQSLSGNQPSTDTIPTVIMDQMSGLPMNQVDSRYEQGVTLPSDTQPQTSSESVSTLQQPSTESGLPTGQSTSEENLINTTNTSINPASEDVGKLPIPSVPIINPNVQNLGERIIQNNARLEYIDNFYNQNPVIRKGNVTMTFGEIDPVEALGGTPKTSRVTEDNLTYISAREGLDAQGNPISVEQETKLYEDWKAKGYGEVYERDGRPVFATNEKGRKELAPLYQTQTEPTAPTVPTIEEPPTPLKSFLDELSLYGAVPTDEERERMVDTDYREEYLLSTQAAYWAKENGTTFQEEYDRLNTGAKYDNTQKVQIASTILDVFNEGIEREGNSADTKEEQNYYNAIRQNPQVLADFGDYLAKNGMDDISFIRGRSFTYQKNRKRLIDEYTNFRLEKEQLTMEAAEQSAKASEARLSLFERNGDIQGYNAEVARINGFENTYNQAATRAKQIQDNYANVQPIFKNVNRQNEELADFTVKIENNEVGANTVNILGQIPLVIGQKVTSLIGGIGRIANAAIGSENFRDALDIMATQELKVGNVTAGKIANRVEYFKDANGSEYKEINGTLYSYKDGKIQRIKGNVDKSQLTSQSKDTEYNFTGVVNMTTGLVVDALLTRGAMSGLSRGSKFVDYASKSKRVGEFFGANSQMAKGMSSLSTVMKNPSAANFAYWNAQFMQDSYIAAKEGGITSETGRYIYAISQSVGLATISQINPDINILKAMGNSNRSLVNALLRNDIPAAQKAFGAIMDYGKKAGINVAKEVPEELLQQGYQDFSAMLVNEMADKNIQVSEIQDYKELAVGTIGSVALAAVFGGRANVNIGGDNVDVNKMTQPEILTLLARTPNGLEQLKSAKEDVYFESQRMLTDTLINDVETRKKYLDKIPDIEKYSVAKLSEVVPVMQELERKREQLKNDDGTFAETLNNEINSLTSQVNSILAGQPEVQNTQETPLQNEETPQPAQESETVQEQTTVAENEPEQTAVQQSEPITPIEPSGGAGATAESSVITNEEQQPETTNESNEGTVATEQNILPDVEDDVEFDENGLNRLVGILNEAAQGNNIETDGNTELGIGGIQQGEQGGQENTQAVSETTDSTGNQEDAEVGNVREENGILITNTPSFSDVKIVDFGNANLDARDYSRLVDAFYNNEGNWNKALKNGVENLGNGWYRLGKTTDGFSVLHSPELDKTIVVESKNGVIDSMVVNNIVENNASPVQQTPTFSDNEQTQTLNSETVDQGKILSAEEKKINNFIGLKNGYNRLSKAKKNQKEGKALLSRIIQASRELGIPVGNAGDGKLSIKNPKTGKEMAKIRETVTEKTPSKHEIEFAKSHIPDLILWNGDASSPRWDTDISWADIRKGAADIEKGNTNTTPAKRLINEVNRQANDLGGFNFIAGGGKIVSREFASLQEIEDSKKAFPKGWDALDNLTDEELKQIYDERKESEEEFYTNRALQDENTNVYEQGQDVQSEGASSGEATNSPEYQQLLKDRTAQESKVKSAKEKLDRVNKTTNNDFQADQENLFGERKTDGGMFDERADGNAGKEIIANAKREYDQAKADLAKTNKAIRDFESGNASGTGKINFQRTEPSAQSLPQPVLEGLIEKLKKPFKKAFKNLNVVFDWKTFAEKAKAMGINNVDMQRMQVAFDYRMSHTAPNGNDEISVTIDRLNEIYPDDVYSQMGWHYYGDGDRNMDKKSHAKLRSLKGKPNAKVTVYRAVPKGVTEINSGDWVSINRDYAVGHGESVLDGEYDIISAEVNANQVYTDANSLHEQGVQFMHDTQGEIYGAVLPDGTIYLNPDRLNANTAIHEFTHLWEQIMPNAWKKGVELFKNTQTGKNIFNQLKEEGNYSNLNEEQLWSEALNTHLGNYGGENWQNIRAQSNMDKLRDWFRDFIAKIGEVTGLNSYFGAPLTPETKLDRFTKGVMQDLFNGKALNPESGFEATDVPVVIKQMSDSELETMLTDLGVIQKGKCA